MHRLSVLALGATLLFSLTNPATAQTSGGAAAAAAGTAWEVACASASALKQPIAFDTAALSAVTDVVVVTVSECESGDLAETGAIAALQSMIAANASVQAKVRAVAGKKADIVAATLSGGTLTVYVRS
jgi:hypothetical protein